MEQKQPKIHSVQFNFVMNVILKLSAVIFPLITFPYVSRILGPEGNGKITFATSVISYFAMFAQLGIPTYGIKVCAECRDDREKLSRTVQELLAINLVSTTVSYFLLAVCMQLVPRFREEPVLMWMQAISILLNTIGMDWLYQAVEQYSYITIRNILFKLLALAGMFLLVKEPSDYLIYGGITLIGSYGSNLWNLFYSRRLVDLKFRRKQYQWKQHLKPILSFFALSAAATIYVYMDSIMLGFLHGDTELGYYNAATKVKTILVSLVTALGTVLLPRISNYLAHGKRDKFEDLVRQSLGIILLATIPLVTYFIAAAEPVILFLAGEQYRDSILPMQIIMVTVLLIGVSNLTGMQILVPLNLEKYTVISTCLGAVVNLIINALLIPGFRSAGAAVGTVAAEGVVLLVQVLYLRGKFPFWTRDLQLWKLLAANAAALGGYGILRIAHWENQFLFLAVSATAFFCIYLAVLLLLREKVVWQQLREILGKKPKSRSSA